MSDTTDKTTVLIVDDETAIRNILHQAFQNRVVMISGVTQIDTALECIKKGACDYITKPFSLNVVTSCIDRALERRRLVLETGHISRTWKARSRHGLRSCRKPSAVGIPKVSLERIFPFRPDCSRWPTRSTP